MHPEIQALNDELLDNHSRHSATSEKIKSLTQHLKDHLKRFVQRFDLQVLIVENAVSLPMNVPLGLAITEVVAENNLPTIAHHHDFAWERERYATGAAADYLRAAFPPTLDQIHHVVINSQAEKELALHAGVSSTVIPNVMDFDSPPLAADSYCSSLREDLDIRPDQYILLQPTRIVPRKRIEKSIELARRLGLESVLVISHRAGDEGQAYKAYLADFAGLLQIQVRFAADICSPRRGIASDGSKIYSCSMLTSSPTW